MITLHLEKLYRYPRIGEHMSVAVPFRQGQLTDESSVRVLDGKKSLPVQCKTTARYADGSVKYLFVRFQGDLPGNEARDFALCTENTENADEDVNADENTNIIKVDNGDAPKLQVQTLDKGFRVENGDLSFTVQNDSRWLLENYFDGRNLYQKTQFEGPYLTLRNEEKILPVCGMRFETWSVAEQGPLCVILKARGTHKAEKGREIGFEVWLTAWAGKPWIEISYRLINTSPQELAIGTLGFYYNAQNDTGVTEPEYCTGYSTYKTKFTFGRGEETVTETVTANRLLFENNEQFGEVMYGAFFADRRDSRGGICATVYQAQQNYPKAVRAGREGMAVMLVPEGEDRIVMQPGMSRTQRFLLHFHGPEESVEELNNRSLIYQMPDRPVLSPQVFKEAGVMPDIFPEIKNRDTEIMLCRRADSHNRGFGMLNWGDSIDKNYTNQGRGGGKAVWTNNEYDYVHACALMYARTGVRRFLDYCLVSASHWMDVDVCHYSDDPLRLGAQIEHTKGHVIEGKVVPSHQWVEGLLDYYHFTGDERGLECAIGIGENVLRLLETPTFAKAGEMSARETGWALRTLTALYVETGEEKWLEKGQWIVGHFRQWEEEYGHWFSPYTDNTLIRVPFMISVAVGSLMRYYRVRPGEELRAMILRAIDDMVENCVLDTGLFYYKELPGLQKNIDNPLPLEAMAIGYELTGDKKYLEAGLMTFRRILRENVSGGGQRQHMDDAVIIPGEGTKLFGQGFLPLATFDRALEAADMRRELL